MTVLSYEFLYEVHNMKHKNLAIELLKRLIKEKVKSVSRKNLIKSRKSSEML
jgi:type I restriction enzyme R subunit